MFAKTTPVGFEPTQGDPIGLAGRRLSHSAKVSLSTGVQFFRAAVFLSNLKCQIRCSIVVSISACHAEDPGSIPGGGVFLLSHRLGAQLLPFFFPGREICLR